MRYFEDLEVGQQQLSAARRVTLEEILSFARQYDPQYFHADPAAAETSVFGEVIASGIFTLALWRRLDHEIAADIRWICGIAWDEVRWPIAVRAGDRLRARATCISKAESKSDPRRGTTVFLYELVNQKKQVVFTCKSTNLIERRAAAPIAQS
jgi:acyl dehydratase